jgi:hypothetical protein
MDASATRARRILLPVGGESFSERALDAALRLAHADGGVLVALFLAAVPRALRLDAPRRRRPGDAVPILEAIERRAVTLGVPVDARISTGRDARHALRRAMSAVRFDRIVVAAAREGVGGLRAKEVAWLLANAPGEILVLRADLPAGATI